MSSVQQSDSSLCRICLRLQLNLNQNPVKLKPLHRNPARPRPAPSSVMMRYKNTQNNISLLRNGTLNMMHYFPECLNDRTSGWALKVVEGSQRSRLEGWSPVPAPPPVSPVPKHLTKAASLKTKMKMTCLLQQKSQGIYACKDVIMIKW